MINLMGLPGMADPESLQEAAAFAGKIKIVVLLAPIPMIVAAWLLAEYFCGKRRLLLPSMALSGFIVWASSIAAAGLAIVPHPDEVMIRKARAATSIRSRC